MAFKGTKALQLFIIFALALFCSACFLYGCTKDSNSQTVSNDDSQEVYESYFENESLSNSVYKYINGYATFSCEYKDGYVILTDTDYSENETYYGKVRWCDEKGQNKIVSAFQVISADGKEIYEKALDIVDLRNENKDNHIWDYMSAYDCTIKAKCSENAEVECYIKMIDSAKVEYRVMLTPVEEINKDGYAGAAVYIIDEKNNKEFWYDNMIFGNGMVMRSDKN